MKRIGPARRLLGESSPRLWRLGCGVGVGEDGGILDWNLGAGGGGKEVGGVLEGGG